MMNCMAKMVMIIWLVDQVTTVWMAAQDQMHCMGMMATQFHENDVRDTSVYPVSEDVYEIRLGDQVAAHVKSTVPFDASSIVVQTHT